MVNQPEFIIGRIGINIVNLLVGQTQERHCQVKGTVRFYIGNPPAAAFIDHGNIRRLLLYFFARCILVIGQVAVSLNRRTVHIFNKGNFRLFVRCNRCLGIPGIEAFHTEVNGCFGVLDIDQYAIFQTIGTVPAGALIIFGIIAPVAVKLFGIKEFKIDILVTGIEIPKVEDFIRL